MTDHEYTASDEQRPTSRQFKALDLLYHGGFQVALTDVGFEKFSNEARRVAIETTSKIGSLFVQCVISDKPDAKLSSWFGVQYDSVVDDQGLQLEVKGAVMPTKPNDPRLDPKYSDSRHIVIAFEDVAWDRLEAEQDSTHLPGHNH